MTVAAWAATSDSKVRASENESGTSLSSPRTYVPTKANARHPEPSQSCLTSISIDHPRYCRASSPTGSIVPLCPQRVAERITSAATRVLSGHYESVTGERGDSIIPASSSRMSDREDPVLLSAERQQGSPRPAHEPWTRQC